MVDVPAIFQVILTDPRPKVGVESSKPESNRSTAAAGKKNKKAGHEKQKKEQKAAYGHRWLLTTLKGHSGSVLNLDFSGNGKYLASCADGGSICWNGRNPCQSRSRQHQVNQPNNNATGKNMDSNIRNNKKSRNNNNNNSNNHTQNNFKNGHVFEPIPVIKTNLLWPNFFGARPPLQMYCALAIEGLELYQQLYSYVLTRDERRRCGYPVECLNQPGKVEVTTYGPKEDLPEKVNPEERLCCRCNSRFIVTEDGNYEADETCSYHWGKFKAVEGGDPKSTSVFSCCDGSVDSPGCTWSKFHVSQQPKISSRVFVKTRNKKSHPSKGGCVLGSGVYALDCEMCYTWAGLEVAKVTVVGPDGFVIYDSLVLPDHPIVDYNTNFSGITANDMKNVSTTLADVHAVLLKLFNSKTILIGHGLENDLKALRLLHETIIDTSVIFPHYYGLPYRRSLKSLMNCYLQKTIQDGRVGHDSAEDARACMELMLFKVLTDRQMGQPPRKV